MHLFALSHTGDFGRRIACSLGIEPSPHEEREFEDGEHKARPLVSVRGASVYVVQSLHGEPAASAHDKLIRLLFFLAALKENGATQVTAVVPYLAYGRKDRQTKPRDPVTTRYMAQLFEAVGADRVITLEVHNIVAFQNAFRCQTVHLDTRRLFIAQLRERLGTGPVVVASPDPGGVKRAQLFREALEAALQRPVAGAFLDKRRSAGIVSGDLLVGEVAGATVLLVDDLVSTGGTLARAAATARAQGAERVFALAAHGLFVGDAGKLIANSDLTQVFVTDSASPFRLPPQILQRHVSIVEAAPLFARAIACCEGGGSITELLEGAA